MIARTHTGEFWSIQAKYRTDTAASLNRPADLPSKPAATYAQDGFTTWPDFLHANIPASE